MATLIKLYRYALAEGEGLGTAYEYFVKLRLMNKFIDWNGIKDVLIYGLPEKYGYSLDFLYLSKQHGFNVDVYEERDDKISKFKVLCEKFGFTPKLCDVKSMDKTYDLMLSCETFQSSDKIMFVQMLDKCRRAAIFVPNGDNESHAKISELRSMKLGELRHIVRGKHYGYIDMPPFPPGIKKKEKIQNRLFIDILQIFALIERYYPRFIKKKLSHIVYLIK